MKGKSEVGVGARIEPFLKLPQTDDAEHHMTTHVRLPPLCRDSMVVGGRIEPLLKLPQTNDAEHHMTTPVRLPPLCGDSMGGAIGSLGGQLSNEVLRSKIENEESIVGQFDKLMFTHNTNALGLLGILASNRMLATVERNVNFRYGIDSRYSGGVTLIMKDGFYKEYNDFHIHDLYNQRFHVMGDKDAKLNNSSKGDMNSLLRCVSNNADFRKLQMKAFKGSLMPISKMGKNKKNKLSKRYQMSLVNPQLRVPWSVNKITINDIDKVFVAEQIDDEIMASGYVVKVEEGMRNFSTYLLGLAGDDLERSVRSEVASVLKSSRGEVLINKYRELRRSGFIEVAHTNGANLFSHQAGRIAKRGRKDEEALRNAARLGLDIHADYFEEGMNNSPSALSLSVLTEFEKLYFNHLLKRVREQDLVMPPIG